MRASRLRDLGLERYARLLRGAAGGPLGVACADADGALLWATPDAAASELAPLLAPQGGSEDDPRVEGPGWQDLPAGAGLLRELPGANPGEIARIAVHLGASLPDPSGSEALRQRVAAALGDVAACLASQQQLAREADGLAVELGSRYEELNLLYSLESHVQAFDQGNPAAEALLHNLTERLEIDLAALVLPSRAEPIYAARSGRPLPNLDLVLTAVRGDLFRFATTARSAFALNSEDDPRRHYLLVNMPYRVLACPVLNGKQTPAVLVLLREPERPEFSNGDLNLGVVIASQLAMMMRNHGMFSQLQRFGEQIAGALIEAIEAKDPYTRGHSERVQKGSVALAGAAGLGAEAVEDVSWGALLHDVGKIGIPDSIICKAGGLSDDEYTMIKTHAERSYEIIRHIDHLRPSALRAARHHHERFDGGGYPHGLSGSQIPVESRAISIADTYDALTSSRSYRAAASHAKAMKIIRGEAGHQFDPELVQFFDAMWERAAAGVEELAAPEESGDA